MSANETSSFVLNTSYFEQITAKKAVFSGSKTAHKKTSILPPKRPQTGEKGRQTDRIKG